MRKVGVTVALLLALAGCSDKPELVSPAGPGASASAPVPSGPPAATVAPTGTASDKAACAAVRGKLGEWTAAFGKATAPLVDAGNDVGKVTAVINAVRSANGQFATALKAQAGKTKDAEVKKVALDLAAALEKVSSQLDAQKIANDHGALSAVFAAPEYSDAASAFERVCA